MVRCANRDHEINRRDYSWISIKAGGGNISSDLISGPNRQRRALRSADHKSLQYFPQAIEWY